MRLQSILYIYSINIFGHISNSSLTLDPLPISGVSPKSAYPVLMEVGIVEISSSKVLPIQSYGGKAFGEVRWSSTPLI